MWPLHKTANTRKNKTELHTSHNVVPFFNVNVEIRLIHACNMMAKTATAACVDVRIDKCINFEKNKIRKKRKERNKTKNINK